MEKKKDLVRRVVELIRGKFGIPEYKPYINFEGCADEDKWNQLAHYHPDQNMICISKRQLNIQNFVELRHTIIHEVTHALGLNHGPKFERIINEISTEIWSLPLDIHGPIDGGKQKSSPEELEPRKLVVRDDICKKNDCDELIDGKCGYCGKGFCNEHLRADIVTNLNYISSIRADKDHIKWIKYNEDWQRKDGHPCPEFTQEWNDWYKQVGIRGDNLNEPQPIKKGAMNKSEIEVARKRLGLEEPEKIKQPVKRPKANTAVREKSQAPEPRQQAPEAAPKSETPIATPKPAIIKHKTKKTFKPWLLKIPSERLKKWFSAAYHAKYTKGYVPASHGYVSTSRRSRMRLGLPIKALLIAIAVTVLSLPPLNLIAYGSVSFTVQILASLLLFTNFLITVILALIYDKLVTRHYLTYQALVGGFLLAVLISTGVVQSFTNNMIVNFLAVFLILFIGFAIGGALHDKANYGNHLAQLNGGTAFLILIWLVYLFANISVMSGGSGLSALLSNFITKIESGVGSGSNVQSSSSSNGVSNTWETSLQTCTAQTTSLITLIRDRLPSSTQIGIINTTLFEYPINASNILTWGGFWDSGGVATECGLPVDDYLCNDATQAIALENKSETLVAIGIVIKVDVSASGGLVRDYPLLCGMNGNLLNGSKNLPANIP